MHAFIIVLSIVLQITLIAALADFIAGAIHWAEDAYFTENTPIIGPLFIRPNIVHHHHPRFFTHLTWWQSSWDLVLLGGALLLLAWPLGLLSWQLGLFVALSINANEIHKWSHRSHAENGRIISALQDWHVLQTPRHHGLHHSDPKNTYYCPITNFVNPLLERLEFWQHAESVVEFLTGVTHRADTAVRGQGPGPDWLKDYRRSSPASPATANPRVKNLGKKCDCASCPRKELSSAHACAHHPFIDESTRLAA